MTESEFLTEQESFLIKPFITNLDRAVFGLQNLPEVVKGALFSRYSRSDKSLRRILVDEFIKSPEASFARIVGELAGGVGGQNLLSVEPAHDKNSPAEESGIAIQQAEAFYERVLIGYGDDSVAELGGAHIACEGISNIASIALEDSRLGISPLEKSTRYVPFNRKLNGRYRYYREPSIMVSSHAELYESTLDNLFDTYTALMEPLLNWVQARTPQDKNTSQRAYNNATKAKTFDLLRGLLPMATLTNVGLFGNGRAFEYLLVKLAASPHQEVRTLGTSMQQELDQIIPSFVKRAKTERGHQYARYLSANCKHTELLAQKLLGREPASRAESAEGVLPPPNLPRKILPAESYSNFAKEVRRGKQPEPSTLRAVELVEYDPDAEVKVVAAILYPHTDLTFEQIKEHLRGLSATERVEIISTYVGERESRFHRPGRAFEETYYTFDVLADLGAYRDLHRHRVLTQERQHYSVRHGYVVPIELEEANLAQAYCEALDYAAQTTELIGLDLPEAAQYVVPFAYRLRWRMKLNLREAYHLIELRSSRQGHPQYRLIAQEMHRHISAVHPVLVANMHFVDLNNYTLERLTAEQRIDTKLQQQNQN